MKFELKKGDPCPFYDTKRCPECFRSDSFCMNFVPLNCLAKSAIIIEITATPVKSEFDLLLAEIIATMDFIYYNRPEITEQATIIEDLRQKMKAFAEAHGL